MVWMIINHGVGIIRSGVSLPIKDHDRQPRPRDPFETPG
jgi:hypothetical protein